VLNFLRGVTPRLIGATAVVVFFCTSSVGVIMTWHQHSMLTDQQATHLRTTVQEIGPVIAFPGIRRALEESGESRRVGLNGARLALQRHIPSLTHFSVLAPGRTQRVLYSWGEKLPEPSAAVCARVDRGAAAPELAVELGARVIVACICPVPARAGSSTPVAAVRAAVSLPGFRQFLLQETRRDILWIFLAIVLGTAATSGMFVLTTRSLRSVTSYAAAIEHGQFNMELDIKSRDEARTIAEAFNVVLHQLKHSYVSTLGALAALLETKDRTTETHSLRGVRYAVELGRRAGLSAQELADLEYGALLHDIGKIGIADMILKKAGPLTEEEWAVMRQHPTIGYNVLRSLDFLQNALPVVLHHQERYDGRGYPNGLKGEQIPVLARIFTIADSFDAMTSERPYRRAMRPEIAIQEVKRNAGSQFDPRLADIFARLWSEGKLQDGDAPPGAAPGATLTAG